MDWRVDGWMGGWMDGYGNDDDDEKSVNDDDWGKRNSFKKKVFLY